MFGIVFFALSILYYAIWEKEHELSTIFSLLIGIAAGLAATQLSAAIRDDNIFAFLKNNSVATHLGKSHEIHGILVNELMSAHLVRNTFIVAPGYKSPKRFEEEAASFYNCVLKDGDWIDIINKQALEDLPKRFSSVKCGEGSYTARVLKDEIKNVALPCFVLCNTREGESVFFGWNYKKDKKESEIFYSRSPELISVFERYWSTLESDSVSEEIPPGKLGIKGAESEAEKSVG